MQDPWQRIIGIYLPHHTQWGKSMDCPNCGRNIPADSSICPYCGTRVVATALQDRPATGPTMRLDSNDQLAGPVAAEQPPAPQAAASSGSSFGPRQAVPIGAIWLIGIAVLAITGLWWPGILVLVGLTAFVSMINQGRLDQALSSLIFFCGMAVIAWFNWWWPGMLILIGVMMLLNAGTLRKLGR